MKKLGLSLVLIVLVFLGFYKWATSGEFNSDEEFIIDAGNTGQAFGIPTFIAGPPRFFGVQFSVRF